MVVNAIDGTIKHKLGPFEQPTRNVSFSPDGRWLAINFADGPDSAIIADVNTGTVAANFPGNGYVTPMFAPIGDTIAVGNRNGELSIWNWNGTNLFRQQVLRDSGA